MFTEYLLYLYSGHLGRKAKDLFEQKNSLLEFVEN